MSASEAQPDLATQLELTITEAAAEKVGEVMGQQDLESSDRNLRLFVQGMGCAGPMFGLAFDKPQEGDIQVERTGLKVLVDPQSAPYVHGSTIDFVQTPEIEGFKVTNPRLAGCSSADDCGPSGCPPGCG